MKKLWQMIVKHALLIWIILVYLGVMLYLQIYDFFVGYLFFDIAYSSGDNIASVRDLSNSIVSDLSLGMTVFLIVSVILYFMMLRRKQTTASKGWD
ncbi:hypothetical protein G7061_00565 [Erysipelothrix sp. HDW6B]|uniref:hypothetical protein n=2 Tax=Erysipelothrix TaxID=1647 RepID=UPI00140D5D33|nr:hypothetical protein [Erysipelothrix sp. HDW6B]QIK85193.1 hypothetical protein G7061_00565 [Erysipelothrix sp. HDW6B]